MRKMYTEQQISDIAKKGTNPVYYLSGFVRDELDVTFILTGTFLYELNDEYDGLNALIFDTNVPQQISYSTYGIKVDFVDGKIYNSGSEIHVDTVTIRLINVITGIVEKEIEM